MDIDELTIFGRYNLKDDKVTSVFLQVIGYGGASLLRSFINSCAYFLVLPVFLLCKHELRCKERSRLCLTETLSRKMMGYFCYATSFWS